MPVEALSQKNYGWGEICPWRKTGSKLKGCEVLNFVRVHKGKTRQQTYLIPSSQIPACCGWGLLQPWKYCGALGCPWLRTLVASAEAPCGLPVPALGSDSGTGFKIIQIIYVLLVITLMFIHYSDWKMKSNSTVTLWKFVCGTLGFLLPFGFPSSLIAYNTFILLLELSILVKMRAVFCMNLQNWSRVSLLAATHNQPYAP